MKCSNNVQCVHVVQYFWRTLRVLIKIHENRPIMLA